MLNLNIAPAVRYNTLSCFVFYFLILFYLIIILYEISYFKKKLGEKTLKIMVKSVQKLAQVFPEM